jgi:hypothetical protein
MFVVLGSVASGVLSLLVSIALLEASLYIYGRYVLGIDPSTSVGWDYVSFFGRYWKLAAISLPILIFGLGCIAGFWFLKRWLLDGATP